MEDKKVALGIDRFLAKVWADYSLELFLASDNITKCYELLTLHLKDEITGIDSARKTSNQLKRLWLLENDGKQILRLSAKEIINANGITDYSIFHFGMAINVFPIFFETCNKIGVMTKSNHSVDRKQLISRVSEKYANPSSTPRIVDRVVQTLVNWGFLVQNNDSLALCQFTLDIEEISSWFILSLMSASNVQEAVLADLYSTPFKLGVNLHIARISINRSKLLNISRDTHGAEVIAIANNNENLSEKPYF